MSPTVTRPGGFAPPDPPSPSLAGAPKAPLRSGGARPWRVWPVMHLAANEYEILVASCITD
jgi:hypothetical protein